MSFNLSAWALQNRQIVLYLMILLGAVGALSYSKLGQSEDPPFTFKAMVVQTNWPGASAEEVARQVTERIEKKLMETGDYDRIVSFSRPGVSQVTFMAREDIHSSEIPELWYQIRKKISDIRATLPQSIQGPFFNDEFGTTYGNIYALTGKGFDYAVMKDYADRLQLQLQRIRNVGKVELIGLQDEKIWIDLSNTKLATLGLPWRRYRRRWRNRTRWPPPGSSRPPATARSCAFPGVSIRWRRSATSPSASATAPSASATWPRFAAASTIRRRRACASWARTPSAWR